MRCHTHALAPAVVSSCKVAAALLVREREIHSLASIDRLSRNVNRCTVAGENRMHKTGAALARRIREAVYGVTSVESLLSSYVGPFSNLRGAFMLCEIKCSCVRIIVWEGGKNGRLCCGQRVLPLFVFGHFLFFLPTKKLETREIRHQGITQLSYLPQWDALLLSVCLYLFRRLLRSPLGLFVFIRLTFERRRGRASTSFGTAGCSPVDSSSSTLRGVPLLRSVHKMTRHADQAAGCGR